MFATTTQRLATSPRLAAATMSAARRGLQVLHTVDEVRAVRRETRAKGQTLALVPTMGALHDGHLALMATAKQHADVVATSIFVNPAQFAPHEDLDQYPRTLPADVAALTEQGVVSAVFAPNAAEMYPSGITTNVAEQRGTFVSVAGLSHQLEGEIRPHFFRGVATVVAKLLGAVQPDVVVFGQKDAQQCVVVRRMITDLLLPITMIVAPTVREADGLAMSSRNRYLSPAERAVAPALSAGLLAAQTAFEQGEKRRDALLAIVDRDLRAVDTKGEMKVEYVSIASATDLAEVSSEIGPDGAIMSAAVRLGSTRLIDNVLLGTRL
ncbi:pantoate-beta-alanine ligase [Allomyces macrogynus ATCC 38327]|uniref:Pantoate--beta-alanine ligase n=1 Tax=Allomyces macrogynus (strain ATCC 38327) TaxID=578462 RepID=A0A0L0SXQ5_ALLM3|nr:pantoate-beta-alanine ligase [Allomyces macrogynus ATCC 38327]|eukprot:KNE67180.1 pantoate-beta-alanine ligase [Allomyces macrogynus ATCC 38327]